MLLLSALNGDTDKNLIVKVAGHEGQRRRSAATAEYSLGQGLARFFILTARVLWI